MCIQIYIYIYVNVCTHVCGVSRLPDYLVILGVRVVSLQIGDKRA